MPFEFQCLKRYTFALLCNGGNVLILTLIFYRWTKGCKIYYFPANLSRCLKFYFLNENCLSWDPDNYVYFIPLLTSEMDIPILENWYKYFYKKNDPVRKWSLTYNKFNIMGEFRNNRFLISKNMTFGVHCYIGGRLSLRTIIHLQTARTL